MSDESPKIIVDEDWKSQVEREKHAYEQMREAPPTEESAHDDPEMPPASYPLFISMLASEAMIALGQIPNPVTGEQAPRKNQAKYLIDSIAMLHEKTRGNVEPEETQQVEALLHQLRMEFVRVGSSPTASTRSS